MQNLLRRRGRFFENLGKGRLSKFLDKRMLEPESVFVRE
jgi:hypothetical protein